MKNKKQDIVTEREARSIFIHPDDVRKSDPYAPHKKAGTGKALMDRWPEFMTILYAKLEKGAIEYGDSSLMRPDHEIAKELSEEALDLAGWGFLLWYKCRYLQRSLLGEENADTRRR